MKDFTRPDKRMAVVVDTAIEMDACSGCILALQYMHRHAVPQDVVMRVLSLHGPRRTSSAHDNGIVLDRRSTTREPAAEYAAVKDIAGYGDVVNFPVPRTNHVLSSTIDQAIKMMSVHNRYYAEAFLRIHAVKTPVIMRVLFDASRRRGITVPTACHAPASGMRALRLT